jgi:hypothetical protein
MEMLGHRRSTIKIWHRWVQGGTELRVSVNALARQNCETVNSPLCRQQMMAVLLHRFLAEAFKAWASLDVAAFVLKLIQ